MPDVDEMCHCGKPLHYTDVDVEANVRRLVAEQGEFIDVNVAGLGVWRVQRHYIALHGFKGYELPGLGFEQTGIACPKCGMTSAHPKDISEKYCGNCHQFHQFL